MMSYTDLDSYQYMATVQLRLLRRYSPNASAALEKFHLHHAYSSDGMFRAIFVVMLYKSVLEHKGQPPIRFDYNDFVKEHPEIAPFVEQAIKALLEDWGYGNVSYADRRFEHSQQTDLSDVLQRDQPA